MNLLELKRGETTGIVDKLIESREMFQNNQELICISYLNNLLSKDEKILNKEGLSKSFKKYINENDFKEEYCKKLTENTFYEFIFHEFLYLNDLPIYYLNKLFMEISEDLSDIDNEIINLKELKKNEKDNYKEKEINYYIDLNLIEKNEILYFMKKDIYRYAYSEACIFGKNQRLKQIPYSYSKRNRINYRKNLKIDNFSIYENKFIYLDLGKYKTLVEKLNKNDENVILICNDYIHDYNVIEKLKKI